MGYEEPKIQILVADDEPVVLEFMHFTLTHWGYRVILAKSGKEALEKAVIDKPDIILLDYNLQDMDGAEIYGGLKGNPKTADIAVLFVTGSLSEELAEVTGRLGAIEIITKPFDYNLLREILNNISNNITVKKHNECHIG
jgi:CheY-like chemotaxis protein